MRYNNNNNNNNNNIKKINNFKLNITTSLLVTIILGTLYLTDKVIRFIAIVVIIDVTFFVDIVVFFLLPPLLLLLLLFKDVESELRWLQ